MTKLQSTTTKYHNLKVSVNSKREVRSVRVRPTNLCRADVPGSEDGGDGGRAAVRDLRGAVAPLDGAQLREQRPQRRHPRTALLSHFSLS